MSTLHGVGCQLEPLTTAPDHPASASWMAPSPTAWPSDTAHRGPPARRRSAQEGGLYPGQTARRASLCGLCAQHWHDLRQM